MTKAELREKLLGGAVMDDLFAFRNGQDCEIFKATRFERSDDIIYIPNRRIAGKNPPRPPPRQCAAVLYIIRALRHLSNVRFFPRVRPSADREPAASASSAA